MGLDDVTTLQHIAETARTSVSTVSRALANHPDVGAETRLRIQRIAKSLGYRPNWAAQSLVRGRSNLVALVAPGTIEPWASDLLLIAEDVLYADQYIPVFYPVNDDAERERALFELVKAQRPAGVLWRPCSMSSDVPAVAETLAQRKIPLVVMDRHVPDCPAMFVYTDDHEGMASAVRYLAGQGHRRMALLVGPLGGQTMRWRQKGFLDALALEGISPSESLVVETPIQVNGRLEIYHPAYEAARDLLRREDRPTAILASMDEQAWGALDAARDLGLSAPRDVRIIGYGSYIPPHFTRCRLSTVVQDRQRIVSEAVQALLDRMRGDCALAYQSIVVPTTLSIGDT